MSDPHSSPADPISSALAKYAERDAFAAFEERGNQIGLRRRARFLRTFADPVAEAVSRWWDGWVAFSDDLRADRREDAASRLRELAALLGVLQGYWENWEADRADWFRNEAERWNAEAARRERPGFGPEWLYGDQDNFCWQRWLPWQSGGPVAVPNQITGAYQFAQAEDLDDDGLFLDMRGVYLALSHPDRAAELVGRFRNPVRVADVAPAIGLTIFPAPDLVTRWIDGPPPARAIRDARWLFSIAPDLFGRRLRDELDRRLPGPSNAAWSDSVEAERVPIEYVREHLTEGIRRELDRWREAVSRLPQIEHDLGVDREVLGEFDFRVDRQVRLALLMLDELTGRLHEVEAIDTALRRNYCIVSPAGTHGRSASELLDTSVTQAIFILLAARNLESEGRSFAAAAARSRGIIGPGQPLTDDALRELRVMTRPPELAPSDDAPDEIAGTDPPGPSILPAEGDGPFGTNGFRFAGAEVQFGRAGKQYRLVMALWDAEANQPAPPRPVEDVIQDVYGAESDTEDAAFRQLCSDVRRRLQAAHCPLDIQPVNGKVQLARL